MAMFVAATVSGNALAQNTPSPDALYYGGTLYEQSTPATGNRDFLLELYDTPSGGTARCATDSPAVQVRSGAFRFALSPACVALVSEEPDLFLRVVVGSTEIIPGATGGRPKVSASPYAIEAKRANEATRVTGSNRMMRSVPVPMGTHTFQPGVVQVLQQPVALTGANAGCSVVGVELPSLAADVLVMANFEGSGTPMTSLWRNDGTSGAWSVRVFVWNQNTAAVPATVQVGALLSCPI